LAKITDVTEKKQKEEKINKLLSETLVYNQKLEVNNEELNKLNTELDGFVYRVSHDLRAPIASTMGLVGLAKSENDINRVREYLDLQSQSLKKLDAFIQDILDYSRNNRQELQLESINLFELINEQIAQYQFDIQKNQIEITNSIDPQLIINSDARRLSVIFSNLISNAIRYSNNYIDDSYVKIVAEKIQDYLLISVADNGIGIPDEYKEEIFKMFFRVSDSGKNGSGLGLYIVKETTAKLKGTVEVISIAGKGSTFLIRLPNNPV
ncbi:MAG: HAMP domain-containing sensor histidine kinase, partial [Bacteroidota bacterium]